VRNKRRIKRGRRRRKRKYFGGSEGLAADGVEVKVKLHVFSWYIDDGVVEISWDQHQ